MAVRSPLRQCNTSSTHADNEHDVTRSRTTAVVGSSSLSCRSHSHSRKQLNALNTPTQLSTKSTLDNATQLTHSSTTVVRSLSPSATPRWMALVSKTKPAPPLPPSEATVNSRFTASSVYLKVKPVRFKVNRRRHGTTVGQSSCQSSQSVCRTISKLSVCL